MFAPIKFAFVTTHADQGGCGGSFHHCRLGDLAERRTVATLYNQSLPFAVSLGYAKMGNVRLVHTTANLCIKH